jgi:hypothetical protein
MIQIIKNITMIIKLMKRINYFKNSNLINLYRYIILKILVKKEKVKPIKIEKVLEKQLIHHKNLIFFLNNY